MIKLFQSIKNFLKSDGMNSSVPVVMYHSVGIHNKKWKSRYLNCPYPIFESHLKWMKRTGFKTISLKDLYLHMKENKKVPKNSVVLTFDDGYLDNWVFVYPLLKKYGFKGTIYVNPDFVDRRKIVRDNLESVWSGDVNLNKLQDSGYLSWEELKIMDEEGYMDVQSHTMTHTWYPKSSKIIDFRHPQDPYLWMTWNNFPELKPYLWSDREELIFYGQPVYENDRSIAIKRYYEGPDLEKTLIDYVEEFGIEFFDQGEWKEKLFKISKEYKLENPYRGYIESDEEYEKRIFFELHESKRIIEKKLNKDVEFVCWPGGGVTDTALRIASEVGYLSSTVGRDILYERKFLKNKYGEDPTRINRMGITLYWNGMKESNSIIKYKNGFFLILSFYVFRKDNLYQLPYLMLGGLSRLYKALYH